MRITLNDAGNGDCIMIQSQDTFILVDGGTAASYKTWKGNIESLDYIDCIIVTHVDNDHVNGVIKLLQSNTSPRVKEIIFNGAKQILGLDISYDDSKDDLKLQSLSDKFSVEDFEEFNIGVSEGTSLSFAIENNGISHNNSLITRDVAKLDIGHLSIEFIGPTNESLSKLRSHWLEVLSDEGIDRKILTKKHAYAFETYLNKLKDDFTSPISGGSFENIDSLADAPYEQDGSLANESSIAFIARDSDSSILMLADCHAESVIDWLNKKEIEVLEVDAVKVSHHGSKHNINRELIERIECDKYLISTNGKKFNHPDLECLSLIAKYSKIQPIKIIINNDITHIDAKCVQMFHDFNKTQLIVGKKEIDL